MGWRMVSAHHMGPEENPLGKATCRNHNIDLRLYTHLDSLVWYHMTRAEQQSHDAASLGIKASGVLWISKVPLSAVRCEQYS